MRNVIKDFDQLLHSTATKPQLLLYDTSFRLGDFYVPALLFRNVLFDTAPAMPSFFLIHKRKLQSSHEEL